MNLLKFFFPFLLISILNPCFAQTDAYTGTWEYHTVEANKKFPVDLELKLASPEKNQLYPASLSIHCQNFSAVYHLLLAKKNIRQLGVGRQKQAVMETPFSLGNWTVMLNGTLDFSKDNKGNPLLTLTRIPAKQFGIDMPDEKNINPADLPAALLLKEFLQSAEIQFKKISGLSWKDEAATSILISPPSGEYFGIVDSIFADTRDCNLQFPGSKKNANGTVSVVVNGNTFIDLADLGYKKPSEEFRLDTGLNLIILFADNYGKTPATTGQLNIKFGNRTIPLGFSEKRNVAATFIAARIYYYPVKEERSADENELSKLSPDFRNLTDDNVFYYPDKSAKKSNLNKSAPGTNPENSLLREAKLLGNIETKSRQVTLAIWDDAIEDGDSISLSINGHWVVQGMAVKKRPQFIIVTLEPGQNKITFIADNLGSIIPNTSVLEIIDGKRRKSFMIDTNLSQNNLVNIDYDVKPGG